MAQPLPNGLIAFGPDANCTIEICPIEWSVLQYRPNIPVNAVAVALFGISMIIHIIQGFRWKTWDFMICMVIGCIDEIAGYSGRFLLHNSPFSFGAFLMQTICVTTAPVFFCSAIYVQLSRTIIHLDRSISRFSPKLLVWTFIPVDILSLILQGSGGAISSITEGGNTGVVISMVGLVLQVITLIVFITLFVDYVVRYMRRAILPQRMKIFLGFLFLAIILILIRCAYRIAELRDGYDGELIHDEVGFMILEALMIILACFALHIGHPGIAYGGKPPKPLNDKSGAGTSSEEDAIAMNGWNAASSRGATRYSMVDNGLCPVDI